MDIQFSNYDWIGTVDTNDIFCESPHFQSDNKAMMLKGMENSILGVWVAHGEGRVHFPDQKIKDSIVSLKDNPNAVKAVSKFMQQREKLLVFVKI